jgi:hypothetical protein
MTSSDHSYTINLKVDGEGSGSTKLQFCGTGFAQFRVKIQSQSSDLTMSITNDLLWPLRSGFRIHKTEVLWNRLCPIQGENTIAIIGAKLWVLLMTSSDHSVLGSG